MGAEGSHPAPREKEAPFRHQALLSAGTDELVARTTPLVQAALDAHQPVLAALTPGLLGGLRESLGEDADRVRWVDITGIGLNPARIIPLWRAFLAYHRRDGRTRPVFGIGQPVYAGRTAVELVEAERHEALLNLAFRDEPNFDLVCPYDVETLDAEVVEAAGQTHPQVRHAGPAEPSTGYRPVALSGPFTTLLPAVDGPAPQMAIDRASVADVRRFVVDHAERLVSGGHDARWSDLSLAALAVSAAIGGERLRIWPEPGRAVVEIQGRVPIVDPLAGREWPAPAGEPGHGLWLANQLCDLVQWGSDGHGSLVRLRQG